MDKAYSFYKSKSINKYGAYTFLFASIFSKKISPAEHLCYWSVCEGAAILHLLSTFRAFWHASARDIFSCLFVDWAGSRSASYSGCLCSGGCCLGHHMCRCFSYNMIIFLKNYWIWRLIRWISNILSLKTDIFRGGHTVFIWNSITKKNLPSSIHNSS